VVAIVSVPPLEEIVTLSPATIARSPVAPLRLVTASFLRK
jgi:hypothetical protein